MAKNTDIDKLNAFYEQCMNKCREWGLEPFETDFHIVPSYKIYEVASYGLPGHFSHWTYGKEYWKEKSNYDRGYGRIYELVINADPAQAFLLDTNTLLDNMFVIAHVCGHSDFFANNAYFDHTSRKILQSTESAAERFREYEIKYGRDVVEDFIDDVFAIKEHINPHLRVKAVPDNYEESYATDSFIDLFPEEQAKLWLKERADEVHKETVFPVNPEKDLLAFIAANNLKLKAWQRDVIMTIREEMLYFLPQMQTKIMNEGWASIMHNKLMHELDPECDPGGIDFADIHSGVLSPRLGALNPYWLGYNIYKHIIEKDGWEAALEIRALERDESFLRNNVDEAICEKLDLFQFEFDSKDKTWWISEKKWEKVRDTLAASKANMGYPYIVVVDSDGSQNGTLVIQHKYDGRILDHKWAAKTLRSLCRLWGKPVRLLSRDENDLSLSFDINAADQRVIANLPDGNVKLYD